MSSGQLAADDSGSSGPNRGDGVAAEEDVRRQAGDGGELLVGVDDRTVVPGHHKRLGEMVDHLAQEALRGIMRLGWSAECLSGRRE